MTLTELNKKLKPIVKMINEKAYSKENLINSIKLLKNIKETETDIHRDDYPNFVHAQIVNFIDEFEQQILDIDNPPSSSELFYRKHGNSGKSYWS